MAAYFLRPKAREDLERIGDYTLEFWGERQEEVYLGMLNRALFSLVEEPELGRPVGEIAPGLRKFRAGRHMVFYLISEPGIDVVRILHQSMDFERHF